MSVRDLPHLDDEQTAAALAGADGDDAAGHLAECAACREEIEKLGRNLLALRQETLEACDKPEAFWTHQRLAAVEPARRQLPSPRFAWVAGLALLAGLGGLYLIRPPATVSVSSAADPDHELLQDVERAIRRDLPKALEPAALIAVDLDRAAQAGGAKN
jgi:anti-sigma factor RsiW